MSRQVLDPEGWSPEVHRRLVALITTPPREDPLAVFDWDDTIAAGDVSINMLRMLDAENGTNWHDTYFSMLESGGRALAYPQILRWFVGWTPDAFSIFAASMVQRIVEAQMAWVRAPMRNLLGALREHGWTIRVVTASPELLVAQMAPYAGLDPAWVHGMRLQLDHNGRMCDALDGIATFAEGKRDLILARYGRGPDLCAGDSSSDAPMMRIARHALLIDGHDAPLHREAVAAGWMIQSGWPHTEPEPGVETHAR